MKKGNYIVFEGISGTGKETQAKLLQKTLQEDYHIDCRIVYHPTPSLKPLLHQWRKNRHIDAQTEVYLLLADRYDRMTKEISPLLKKGVWVISLRNYVSAMVYQGSTEENRDWIAREFSVFESDPDIFFYFKISPDEALLRIHKRHDETGEPLGKFETKFYLSEKIRDYESVLKDIAHVPIDAHGAIESIEKTIHSHLISFLPRST